MPSELRKPGSRSEASGARRFWLPAATFLAGCALGGVVAGVGVVGDDEPTTTSVTAATSAGDGQVDGDSDDATAGGPAEPGEAGLYVRVPASCVQTAEEATTLVAHVDRVVAAVADLEPERLRQTVDEVQQLRDGVQDVAQQCRTAAAQRLQDAAAEEAVPAEPTS